MSERKVSLGFTEQNFDPGVHVCQIYNNEDERHNALIDFVITGMEANENISCFTEKEDEVENYNDIFDDYLTKPIDLEELKLKVRIFCGETSDIKD